MTPVNERHRDLPTRGLCFQCALQNALHELALRLVISLPVTTKFAGKLPLQQSIGIRVRCVRSKIIPKRDVPVVFPTARWAYIQVMLNSGSVRPEGLTSADTQIAFVLISQLS